MIQYLSQFLSGTVLLFALSLQMGCAEKTYTIKYHQDAIAIDGKDKESHWSKSERFKDFLNPWETTPDQGTIFKSYNDGIYLYFYFEVKDSQVICYDHDNNNTAVEYSDRVELFFAKDTMMTAYCGFEIDACGRNQQFYAEGYRKFVKDWSFPAFSRDNYYVKGIEGGYAVEGKLALKTFSEMGFIQDDKILMGIFRADCYRENDEIKWISWKAINTPKPDFHTIQGFKFAFIESK